jgi:hypothetical protein
LLLLSIMCVLPQYTKFVVGVTPTLEPVSFTLSFFGPPKRHCCHNNSKFHALDIIRVICKVTLSSPCLSLPIPSFSGICKVRKFY